MCNTFHLCLKTSYSCSNNSNLSNPNSNHSIGDSSKPQTTVQPAVSKRSTAIAPAKSTITGNSLPMHISPNFIEHKYSGLAMNEKFFLNLRAGKAVSSSSGGDGVTSTLGHQSEVAISGSGGGGGLRAVAVGQMCALQNEHIHQNLYKKTIN
ncbi:uncharacterized protein LOC122320718 [Drosophila ficusphila]|uniref:uncharacterized protein LOC122320718 n=1 Tax=Drosophila ficusphila TaxID=30025 RepID=UPI001C899A45|nr:uncharacterized protein LOC122320718 [Drosophila ficusphila]